MKIIYYDHLTKEQYGTRLSKAIRLKDLGRVKQVDCINWQVLPIKGYNTRTYDIHYDGTWSCNCQYHTKNGTDCSHILAVNLVYRKPPTIRMEDIK